MQPAHLRQPGSPSQVEQILTVSTKTYRVESNKTSSTDFYTPHHQGLLLYTSLMGSAMIPNCHPSKTRPPSFDRIRPKAISRHSDRFNLTTHRPCTNLNKMFPWDIAGIYKLLDAEISSAPLTTLIPHPVPGTTSGPACLDQSGSNLHRLSPSGVIPYFPGFCFFFVIFQTSRLSSGKTK